MEYRKFGKTYVVRLDLGENIVESIKKIATKENIKLAMVNGLGAVDTFELGIYDVKERKYYRKNFDGHYEITSLHGSINTMDGEVYTHLHLAVGDHEFKVFGGHLYEATIGGTGEIFIDEIDGTVDRQKDDKTGINVFKFS